jgi:putative tryptophan/tyrosine transport system substrate-binding protein
MTAPHVLHAQQRGNSLIGILDATSGSHISNLAAFHEGLEDAGYARGLVPIEYRWRDSSFDRLPALAAHSLPALAADLVSSNVDVIVTGDFNGLRAVRAATSSIPIPIVFFGGSDLVAGGLIESLDRPGANVTGIVTSASERDYPRQLDVLSELVPGARVIALLVNPNSNAVEIQIREAEEAARPRGLQVRILRAGTEGDFETAFASLAQLQVGGMVVGADPFFDTWREQVVALAARYALPTIYKWREFPEVGGLISYGPSRTAIWRQLGVYAGKILKGAKPGDLPIQQPRIFELVANLNTAKALGLTIPQSILARADEVIE